MTDTELLDNTKLDADALGIEYRSDIKASTLQAKIDKHNTVNNPSAVKPKVNTVSEPTYQIYKNTSKNNVFTEVGKCSPNRMVKLTTDEAAQYSDLELCVK